MPLERFQLNEVIDFVNTLDVFQVVHPPLFSDRNIPYPMRITCNADIRRGNSPHRGTKRRDAGRRWRRMLIRYQLRECYDLRLSSVDAGCIADPLSFTRADGTKSARLITQGDSKWC
jgi:hypothetical protein